MRQLMVPWGGTRGRRGGRACSLDVHSATAAERGKEQSYTEIDENTEGG